MLPSLGLLSPGKNVRHRRRRRGPNKFSSSDPRSSLFLSFFLSFSLGRPSHALQFAWRGSPRLSRPSFHYSPHSDYIRKGRSSMYVCILSFLPSFFLGGCGAWRSQLKEEAKVEKVESQSSVGFFNTVDCVYLTL